MSLLVARAAGGPRERGAAVGEAFDRVRALLAERRPTVIEDAMAILADHGSEPESVCLHPEAREGDEASSTLFAMVCHLEQRRLWVAPGNPCEVPFEEVDRGEAA